MIYKTKGIVLTHTRYGESSAIVHIYTSDFGMQSYMVNGAYGKKKKNTMVLLQPLSSLEMDVYHHPGKDIQRIKEFRLTVMYQRIPYSQTLRAQAYLLTEILWRSLRGEGPNQQMFDFIEEALAVLDSGSEGLENFHIWFLFQLTRHLGFQPHDNYNEECRWFDLMEGCFVSGEPAHIYYLSEEIGAAIHKIANLEISSLKAIASNIVQRRELLSAMIRFFELHQPGIGKIRSLNVLKELFV